MRSGTLMIPTHAPHDFASVTYAMRVVHAHIQTLMCCCKDKNIFCGALAIAILALCFDLYICTKRWAAVNGYCCVICEHPMRNLDPLHVAGYVGLAVTVIEGSRNVNCGDYETGGILILLSGLIRWSIAIAFIVSGHHTVT
jgi:hypothetical protein